MSNVDSIETAQSRAATFGAALRGMSMWAEESIDRSPGRAFFLFSIGYFVVVLTLSSFKLLWLDELITLHIAKLGSASAIWHALARGADPNPPVTHLLVLLSQKVFGDHEFAYRLPATVGYWIGLLSLFLFLKDRLPATWALAGTVLSTTMAAFDYSYESRSYGIFYGLAMLAFLCWSRTVDPNRGPTARRLALIGMVVALAAGISTNYFAVLAFFPIAAGECALTIIRVLEMSRQSRSDRYASRISILSAIDLRIWLGLAIAGTSLLAYRSLIARSIAQFAPYAWNKVSLGEVADSYTEMVEIVLYPLLALFCLGIAVFFVNRRVAPLCSGCRGRLLPRWLAPLFDRKHPSFALPIHEAVGVLFFMLYPFIGYIVASVRGGMLSPRFVIPVCFGFAITGSIVAFQLFGNMRQAGVVFLCFVSAWFAARESYVGYWYAEQKQSFYKVLDHLPEAELSVSTEARIVIPDPLLVLTFQHYAPPKLASRVVFPVDFPAIRFFRHDDSPEENLWAGRNWLYTVPIIPVALFERSASDYLIIASDGNWFLDDLAHHHYEFDRLPINTRAGAIGGFTPLAHGVPTYYTAGRNYSQNYLLTDYAMPVPFQVADNLPGAKKFAH
ncbi:MAG TPA: glycosyltransferase family 39 protein [Terracidiphilus sp.]|nr:glycosyltransferase family 39 protein [Terracidiphilus sp.]